ncbi:dTDP-glucose 4,6-dehydratase [Micromonospora echinospora]|uniref:dTDP-glucose 4,6-dehydratase n=1 Tax=Micromonospora echinospora TaxID=1877 RepID=A0A1C5A3Y7_MICEC|nr:dTDP-glucose 4,6-dehydratase [Micromonospora echinospora]OZV83641.1 dTDP-glucose 4,6-dehydratase [Micromonospora echinospora]SCF39910.1 dTDP-glucose 4,6-dehydratase [Micromonospora echinospora]
MSRNILITGGAGFIGSHYARVLLEGHHDRLSVTVLDKLTYAGNAANLDEIRDCPGFRFVRGDICDASLVDDLVAAADEIVHFAAETHVDRSIASGAEFVRTNVLGTGTLLEAARRHGGRRFVHVSTDEVYGSIASGSWPESHPLRPSSPYSASKAASDLLALSYHTTYGLDVVVTRCCNNFGPRQYPEKIIPLFVTRLLAGRTVPLYGTGENTREWLHVEDHVDALERVRTRGRPGEIYNIGSGAELTNRALVAVLLELCDADWDRVEFVADRPGHDRRYSVDSTKIRTELGWTPRHDLRAALADTVDWYRKNDEWAA